MKVQKLFFEHLSTLYCLPILLEPKILFLKKKTKKKNTLFPILFLWKIWQIVNPKNIRICLRIKFPLLNFFFPIKIPLFGKLQIGKIPKTIKQNQAYLQMSQFIVICL
jgi:hypothetical protein